MNNLFNAQAATVAAVTDALFGRAHREQNEYELLDEAIALANKLELMLGKLAPMFADKRENLATSQEFAGNIMLNLAGHKRDLDEGKE